LRPVSKASALSMAERSAENSHTPTRHAQRGGGRLGDSAHGRLALAGVDRRVNDETRERLVLDAQARVAGFVHGAGRLGAVLGTGQVGRAIRHLLREVLAVLLPFGGMGFDLAEHPVQTVHQAAQFVPAPRGGARGVIAAPGDGVHRVKHVQHGRGYRALQAGRKSQSQKRRGEQRACGDEPLLADAGGHRRGVGGDVDNTDLLLV